MAHENAFFRRLDMKLISIVTGCVLAKVLNVAPQSLPMLK